jgi:hypothetical protein
VEVTVTSIGKATTFILIMGKMWAHFGAAQPSVDKSPCHGFSVSLE